MEKLDKAELDRLKVLSELEKLEMEKTKLQIDGAHYEERFLMEKQRAEADKIRFTQETIRLIAVSLITAVATLLVNHFTENEKQENTRENADYSNCMDLVRQVATPGLPKDSIRKLVCNNNIPLNCKEIAKGLLKEYILLKEKTCEQLALVDTATTARLAINVKSQTEDIEKGTPEKVGEINKVERLQNKLQTEKESTSDPQKQQMLAKKIASLSQHMDSLLGQVANGSKVSKESEQLTQQYTNESKILNNLVKTANKASGQEKMAAGYPVTLWFKPGFYLVFDDKKIYLEKLDRDNARIRVQICASTSAEACSGNNLLKNDWIDETTPMELPLGNVRYLIKLDRVGNAGKNPFTKAAYITIEKYTQE